MRRGVLASVILNRPRANRTIGTVDFFNRLQVTVASVGPGWVGIRERTVQRPKYITRWIYGPELMDTSQFTQYLRRRRRSKVYVRDDGSKSGTQQLMASGKVKKVPLNLCV